MTILVTGGTGLVGRALQEILPDAHYVGSGNTDFADWDETESLIRGMRPEAIIHLAAKVGGVKDNADHPADFAYENLAINNNVLHAAYEFGVKKVVSLMSTCVYPEFAPIPLDEDTLHDGPPYPGNEGYAHAKRMLDVLSCAYRKQYGCDFVTVIPCNIFGKHDNFDPENSHVIPGIIRKMHLAKQRNSPCKLWGTGKPLREFCYAPDIAAMIVDVLADYSDAHPVNIGSAIERTIEDVECTIADAMGFNGPIVWDSSQPDGIYRKPANYQKYHEFLGSASVTDFREAIQETVDWFVENYPNVRGIRESVN